MNVAAALDACGIHEWQLHGDVDAVSKVTGLAVGELRRHASELLQQILMEPLPLALPQFLTTRVPALDTLLGGGIARQQVLELFGPAGVGKTCLACQAALDTKCIYITTEESCKLVARRMCALGNAQAVSQVHFVRVTSHAELRIALHRAKRERPELVVIDSIAAVYDFGVRQIALARELNLREFADTTGAAVLVINQVRGAIPLQGRKHEFYAQKRVFELGVPGQRPAMDLEWAQTLDARIALMRARHDVRVARVLFSRLAAPGSLRLSMSDTGLGLVSDPEIAELDSDDFLDSIDVHESYEANELPLLTPLPSQIE